MEVCHEQNFLLFSSLILMFFSGVIGYLIRYIYNGFGYKPPFWL